MILLGENVNIGVGVESVRGVAVNPQKFVPGRTPTGVKPIVEKVLLKETRKSRSASYGAEIVQIRAEGDIEFNVRSRSIGYLLKSLIADPVTVPTGGAFVHTFNIDVDDILQPSLSLYLAQGGHQNYIYPNAVVKSLDIKTPVGDLVNAKASFVATKEAEIGASDEVEVTWDDEDYTFRPYNVTIKIAADVAGLAAANALAAKEFAFNITNNARPDMNIGNLNPADVLGLLFEIKGSLKVNHIDESWHAQYVSGNYFALQVTFERPDVLVGGALHPKLVLTLPKVSVEDWKPDRPIDELVSDGIDFICHFDSVENKIITAVLTNDVADYDPATS